MSDAHANAPIKPRRTRTMKATLGIIMLGFQLIVTSLGVLGIMGLKVLPTEVTLIGGVALVLLQIIAIGVLQFTGNTVLGWIVEILSVLAGFVHPAMFFAGGIFLIAWIYCMVQGGKIDRARAPIIAEYERRVAAGEIDRDAVAGTFDLDVPASNATGTDTASS